MPVVSRRGALPAISAVATVSFPMRSTRPLPIIGDSARESGATSNTRNFTEALPQLSASTIIFLASRIARGFANERHEMCVNLYSPTGAKEESMRLVLERSVGSVLVLVTIAVLPGAAGAQAVYPARGQSPQQQQQDQQQCQGWAMQQSGPPAPPTSGPQGQGLRSAGRGAAVGAGGGAIGGDAGKGAAIGAATGALVGGMRRRDQRRQEEAAQAQYSDSISRAYAACLEGRGYTVK